MSVTVTCPKCGSADLAHDARYIVRSPIISWHTDENGDTQPDDFGADEVLSDSCEALDYPYACMGCGEFDLVETDLLYDGKPHKDAD